MAKKENRFQTEFNRVGYQTIYKRNPPTKSPEGAPQESTGFPAPSNWLILVTGVVEGPVRLLFSLINQFFTAASALPVVGGLFAAVAFFVMPVVRIAMMAILTITSPVEYIVKPFMQYMRYNVAMSRAKELSGSARAKCGAKAAWAIILLTAFLVVATLVIFSVATGGLGPLAMIGFGAVSAGISTAMGILGLGLAGQIALTTASLLLVGGLLRHFLKPIAFLKFLAGKNDLEYGLRGQAKEGDYKYDQDPECLGKAGQSFNREGIDKMEQIKSFIISKTGQWASVSEKDSSLGIKSGYYRYANSVFEYSDRGGDSHAQSTVTFPAGQNPEYVDAVQLPQSPGSATPSGQLTSSKRGSLEGQQGGVLLNPSKSKVFEVTVQPDLSKKYPIKAILAGKTKNDVFEVKANTGQANYLPAGFYSRKHVADPVSTSSGMTVLEWRDKSDFSQEANAPVEVKIKEIHNGHAVQYRVTCSAHTYDDGAQTWQPTQQAQPSDAHPPTTNAGAR